MASAMIAHSPQERAVECLFSEESAQHEHGVGRAL